MKLLQIFLAAALVLDAAMVMTTTAAQTNGPSLAVGFNNNAAGNGSFSLAASSNIQ